MILRSQGAENWNVLQSYYLFLLIVPLFFKPISSSHKFISFCERQQSVKISILKC